MSEIVSSDNTIVFMFTISADDWCAAQFHSPQSLDDRILSSYISHSKMLLKHPLTLVTSEQVSQPYYDLCYHYSVSSHAFLSQNLEREVKPPFTAHNLAQKHPSNYWIPSHSCILVKSMSYTQSSFTHFIPYHLRFCRLQNGNCQMASCSFENVHWHTRHMIPWLHVAFVSVSHHFAPGSFL